ncbi:MAG: IreB family regulatory phosphoprotein [Clostridia bacterium]
MGKNNDEKFETIKFQRGGEKSSAKDIILNVHTALEKKGYDPINQIVGYLISGDPTYVTSFKDARFMITRIERDELLEELVRFYIDNHKSGKKDSEE